MYKKLECHWNSPCNYKHRHVANVCVLFAQTFWKWATNNGTHIRKKKKTKITKTQPIHFHFKSLATFGVCVLPISLFSIFLSSFPCTFFLVLSCYVALKSTKKKGVKDWPFSKWKFIQVSPCMIWFSMLLFLSFCLFVSFVLHQPRKGLIVLPNVFKLLLFNISTVPEYMFLVVFFFFLIFFNSLLLIWRSSKCQKHWHIQM